MLQMGFKCVTSYSGPGTHFCRSHAGVMLRWRHRRAPKLATKRICIVTDNDTPTRNEQLIRAASYRKGVGPDILFQRRPTS